jgi:hypothetical protein
MKKIDELTLHNFKFFTANDNVLKVGKKHLLLWGENGSGKSSIYWAIYTLLQCSFKKYEDIDAYFTEDGPKNLINIYAIPGSDSFVRIKLDDGSDYIIASKADNVKDVEDVQLSAVSSDFIDYNVVASFMRAYHRDDLHLFEMFEEEIFRYLQFSPLAPPYDFAFYDKAWQAIQKGLEKDDTTKKYPSPGSTTHDQYRALVDAFNLQFRALLGQVTVKANELLKNEFGYDIEIELKYTKVDFRLSRNNKSIDYTQPDVELVVNKYYGKPGAIKKPHSFLNEAKKTAIGLAIRLGILERRLNDNTRLNVLALDDLLISLDMSNRQIVLKLLLGDYINRYQLFIFTHDKQFYSLTKRTIETQYNKREWLFLEMYQDTLSPFPKPYLKPEKNSVLIAEDYLNMHDYPACGIYLRKEVERLLSELLPFSLRFEPKTEDGVTKMVEKNLNDTILSLKIFCDNEGINYTPLKQLKTYKDLLLNPLAHNDNEAPLFKAELQELIKIIKELQKIKRGRLFLPTKKNVNFILNKPDGTFFSVRMKNEEQVLLLEEDGKPERISIYAKCKVIGTSNNGAIVNNEEIFDTIKDAYLEMCSRFTFPPAANISTELRYDNKDFVTRLAEVNAL